ncbi:phosphatidate cytidylyltransferase [Jannaschia aquimarina]|uniref:Phosphatidate cytidylyltransferase n=1 Tax=Jannaschia aquimarina TaxID=935700 RepID=A0A0D1EGE3_9RHOB|nr:phosphatidate cytidylyltransferase [Jannaschia aquimarina]KIT15996.1 Phosphatidate cytidylyltransferase [Jannaschia aquimarina]SNS99633.1 phosphatidate cytidylyltransferase [Jannaschia aquimarina]
MSETDPRHERADPARPEAEEEEPPLFQFEMQDPIEPALAGRFEDLAPRLVTALLLLAVGLASIWIGGLFFTALISLAVGLMIWELATIVRTGPRRAMLLAGTGGVTLFLSSVLPVGFGLPLMMLVPMLAIAVIRKHRRLMVFFPTAIMLAGLALTEHLTNFGFWWMIWLILVVIASDVMGYFAGRMLGGPKFWPRVSPKKTWSGTIAGWVGAGIVGLIWAIWMDAGWETIGISVALAMMAQMGDIAESAVKRRFGVKDSSNLLPGHGGLFDRFDAMLGAALMLLVIESVAEFPPIPGV